ncbi:unnamed protein product [Closterium sp. Yama58-4]|nr:unnamed protein product [Closterium sp. Yama58-4]
MWVRLFDFLGASKKTLVTMLGSLIWVRLFDELARRRLFEWVKMQKLSRKLVHITTGLLFMLFWPLFSTGFNARFFASAVPLINATRLMLLGLGVTRNEGMVKAMSREGSSSELLGGPLYYILTLAFVTITFWRSSPVGGMALALMCGGDGIADIVGRRVGSAKLPWNDQKSWAGSIAMLLFGYGLALATIHLFTAVGFYSSDWLLLPNLPLRVFLVSLGATVVESLPISDKLDDNLTVPLSTVLFGLLLLQQ